MLRSLSLQKCLWAKEARDYLGRLAQIKGLVIIAAVQDQVQGYYGGEMDQCWKRLGFRTDLRGQYWRGYVGVAEDKRAVFEQLGNMDEAVSYSGALGGIRLDVRSCPYWDENVAEIRINGVEFAAKGRGINLVAYDKKAGRVVDSVSIDTHAETLPLARKDLHGHGGQPEAAKHCWRLFLKKAFRRMLKILRRRTEPPEAPLGQPPAPAQEAGAGAAEYRQAILPAKIFPEAFTGTAAIKVRLMYDYGLFMWNSVESLLKAFAGDERFDVCIVFWEDYFPFQQGQKLAQKIGVDCVCIKDYQLQEDNPDIILTMIMVLVSVYGRQNYIEWGKASKLFVALNGMLMMNLSADDFALMPARVAPILRKHGLDYCFWDSLIYNRLERDGYDISGCVEMGNPKFDAIFEKLNQTHGTLPGGWEKLKGKKTFLWAGTHEWWSEECPFEQYIKTVFEYFAAHREAGLIFRPHPQLIFELKQNGIWTEEEIAKIKSHLETTPNIVWDERPDYSISYQTADAIITDAGCGVAVSGLATLKPICVCFSANRPKHIAFPELFDGLYQVQSGQELLGFFDLIRRGEDPLKERREQAFRKCICRFDGKNGQRMKEFITEKYLEKYGAARGPQAESKESG